MKGTFQIMVWIRNLAWLHLLFSCLTVLGGGILGFFPALIANFHVVKRWFNQDFEPPTIKEYWGYYKKDWLKGNLFGSCILLVTYILFIDFNYFGRMDGTGAFYHLLFLVLSYVFLGIIIFLFPTYVHFKYKITECFKFSFLFSLTHPFITFLLILTTILLFEIMKAFPASLLLFSSALVSILWFWGTLSVYRRLDLEVE